MTHITKPMLRLLLDLHDAPNGSLPEPSVPMGTARALVHRDYAKWHVDKSADGWPNRLVISARGRRVVSRVLACGLRGAA